MENKLQPQDLRIGNYVKRNGMVVQVDHKTFWDVKNKPTEYESIPLTEEWLLKFGFVYNEEYNSYMNNGFIVEKIGDLFLDRRYGKVIKTVNALQNFYNVVTDKELTIK